MFQSQGPRLVGAIVLASLAVAGAFVWLRATGPSESAVVPFYSGGWRASGAEVAVLETRDLGLRSGDVVVTVAGRSLEAWLEAAADPALDRPALHAGDRLPMTVVRDGGPLDLTVPLESFPLVPVFAGNAGTLLFTLATLAVGVFVFWKRPREPASAPLLLLATGLFASVPPWFLGVQPTDLVTGLPFWLHAAATMPVYMLTWAGWLHLVLVFPEPRRPLVGRPRLAPLLYALPVGSLLVALALARLGTSTWLGWLGTWATIQGAIALPLIVVSVVLVATGWMRARSAVARQQLGWIVLAGAVSATLAVAFWFAPQLVLGDPLLPWELIGLVGVPLPGAFAVAILRYRLFEIDVVVNRSLVYGGLTVSVVAIYVGTVTLLQALVQALLAERAGLAVSLLAAGVVAVLVQPIRDLIQRAVNRLMYGDRDEPYRAISRLGQRLEATLAPDAVLPAVVETVASALRLPYAAIELVRAPDEPGSAGAAATGPSDRPAPGPGAFERVASVGRPTEDLVVFPLTYQAVTVGRLLLAPRAPGEGFSSADRRLLEDLARQAGVAAHAVRLTADLQRSRERLVAAREEERRRLRRDLHDGLGPTLAGMALKLDVAAGRMTDDPAFAGATIDGLRREVQGAIADVRRLAYDLRPPALDEVGLLGAIGQQAARLGALAGAPTPGGVRVGGDGLLVSIEAPASLPPLPAAVEVAAYRIAAEALANAARHARARHCEVRVSIGDALSLEVRDDGQGLPEDLRAGVGLASMRERAAELGGTCTIESSPGDGTVVRARLPLPAVPAEGAGE